VRRLVAGIRFKEIQLLLAQDQESLVPELAHEAARLFLDLRPAIFDNSEFPLDQVEARACALVGCGGRG
jgi:hypothetical protein